MKEPVELLLRSIEAREQQTRIVKRSRFSDERHRIVAERYVRALGGFRAILHRYGDHSAPLTVPEVRAVASALGVGTGSMTEGR